MRELFEKTEENLIKLQTRKGKLPDRLFIISFSPDEESQVAKGYDTLVKTFEQMSEMIQERDYRFELLPETVRLAILNELAAGNEIVFSTEMMSALVQPSSWFGNPGGHAGH